VKIETESHHLVSRARVATIGFFTLSYIYFAFVLSTKAIKNLL
jgi:hypothetical protein